MSSRKILLNGTKNDIDVVEFAGGSGFLKLKESYSLSSSRADGEQHPVTIGEKEFVEFVFDDETTWFGNSNSLHELFPDFEAGKRSSDGAAELPFTLSSEYENRSIKSVALKLFNVFVKNSDQENAEELAKFLEKKLLENQSGLYCVSPIFELTSFSPGKTEAPYLLFLHGTGSSTKGSFSELNGSSLWNEMRKIYQNNVLAFQHETFTKSPLQNVLELINQLPDEATLHLISHSRGGLVGDTLVRFCNDENGFNEMGLALLKRENREEDLKMIADIKSAIMKKKLTVEKFIRVACPAAGTSILSRRLDFYFNVTLNLISVATGSKLNPVVDAFKGLISAVLDGKNDVNVFPGLEAMCPSSPFLKALNGPDQVEGNVVVISGNANYSLSLKALVVILSKLVFKGENDFVVNTSSMYQGSRRSKGVQYFFDEGAEVNHFSYFKNSKTQAAILTALTSKEEALQTFKQYVPLDAQEAQRGVFGLEGGSVNYNQVSGNKPIVILLPGIMGSNLNKGDSTIWMNYFKMMAGGLYDLAVSNDQPSMGSSDVRASGLIKTSYKKLCLELMQDYDVVTFPYDWRISLTKSAALLNKEIDRLLLFKQPVKIIAHSMGGLLARELIFNFDPTWKKLNDQPGFKLLLLGTPWMGSYRIPNVLAGRDGIIKVLDKLDFAHSKSELVQLFSRFPGILNLLPTGKKDSDFSDPKVWNELQQASKLKWTIPSKEILAEFGKFRKAAQENSEKIEYANIRYIAGKDDITQNGYKVVNGELLFEATARGDASVTWEMGIPSKLRNTHSLYYVNVSHGDLANNESLFPAIKELLLQESTDLLSRVEPVINEKTNRSLVHTEEEDIFDIDELTAIHKLMGIPLKKGAAEAKLPVMKVSVSNGDLLFSNYPVVIGHFKGDGIVSAERVADNYLKGDLSVKHILGNYPGDVGTYQMVIQQNTDFKGAIVVGLGEVDRLTTAGLITSVEKAVTQYTLEYCRKSIKVSDELNGISLLLIGSDYGGLSMETAIRSILQGVQISNAKIKALKLNDVRLIEHVEFVELFEDRALQCFHSLKRIMNSTSDEIQIEFKNKKIKKLLGSRKRLMMGGKSDWWQRLTVTAAEDPRQAGIRQLTFLSSTTAAREEKQVLQSSTVLIEDLLENISTNEKWTPEVAKTIFELLVPNEFKENIKRQADILWVLDEYTASFPWELFQTDIEKAKPLCISSGMIRQLSTTNYRIQPPVNNNNVLIIGDPLTNGYCNQLAGAEKEAREMAKMFGQYDYNVEQQIKQNSGAIVTAMFKQEYKIIHISGHGNFERDHPERSGMIIGNKVFLTPREFNQMSYTPELVFVNCCYLGKVDAAAENLYSGRYKFAANIGTQLIQNGVKVVIAAGWAVDDAAAVEFAKVFYECMFDGMEFGKAVLSARKVIHEKFSYTNTWGAFQCYGDPFYKLKITTKRPPKAKNYIIPQEAEHDVDNFLSMTQISFYESKQLEEELDAILKAIYSFKVDTPELLEKVALCYIEINNYKKAIELFRKVLDSPKATFTVSSIEKFNNVLAKQLLIDYFQETEPSKKKDEERNKKFEEEIDKIIDSLKKLLEISPTSERHSLIGSAYKRKVAICQDNINKLKSLESAAWHYYQAFQKDNDESAYSLTNWLEIEFFLGKMLNRKPTKVKANAVESYMVPTHKWMKDKLEKCQERIEFKIRNESHEYWDLISFANAGLCLWLLDGADKDMPLAKVAKLFRRPWEFIGSKNKKVAEIEHFNLLIEFSKMAKDEAVEQSLTKLKEDLEKLVK